MVLRGVLRYRRNHPAVSWLYDVRSRISFIIDEPTIFFSILFLIIEMREVRSGFCPVEFADHIFLWIGSIRGGASVDVLLT